MPDWHAIIDKYYPAGSGLRDILIRHSRSVAGLAMSLAAKNHLDIDLKVVEAAAMLHDIGIFETSATDILCDGDEPYIRHGLIGARLLRSIGVDEQYCRVAERHTGAGLTAAEIEAQGLPLPPGDYLPHTELEQLICYADKFFSKSGDMKMKDFDRVRRSMARHGEATLARFDELAHRFGHPQV